MEFISLALLPALWLGILTSISPCPLATNIVAISYIGKQVDNPQKVLLTGLFYTLGRTIAYLSIAALIVLSLLSIPEIARFLQNYFNLIVGPLLIIIGLFLLEIIKIGIGGFSKFAENLKNKAEKKGFFGALILGFIFALSFCPLSAGLYFGSLIPLSLSYNSAIIIPSIYGIGTALPVIVFAFIISYAAHYVSRAFNILTKIEWWAQRITGIVFIIIGFYLSYLYIWNSFF